VEVSTDNGTTWHPASGRGSWTYTWTPTAAGTATILVRGVDDSGNIQAVPTSRSVTVNGLNCPCSAWPATAVPVVASSIDTRVLNVGVKFRVDVNGYIKAIRFYKGAANTGTHTGALWTSGGTLLGSGNFASETTTGWQQMNFGTAIPVTANTVYVAGYRAPVGRTAADNNYFATAGVDNGPVHLLRNGVSGSNGVFTSGGTALRFPSTAASSTNYWVDIVFSTTP
jgi:hypothetical protein